MEVIFKLTIYYKIYVLYTINFIGHNMKKTVLLCLLVATLSACVNGDPKSYQIESLDSVMNNEKFIKNVSVHDKFHRTLILSGFCLLKIAKISLYSSFFPKPIKR